MRKRYNTTRRSELIECLATSTETHLTAAMVQERLSNAGISISPATVYRQLEHLAEEGLVVKSTPEGEKSACFELVDRASCHDDSCYHLKCESCGMLFHSDCHEVDKLKMHMSKEHGFLIDARRTVIYGLCQDCRERHQK